MKKTMLIIGGIVAAALIFVTVMLLTDKENPLEIEPTTAVEESLPDIEFFEDSHKEGFINDSTAPAKSVKIAEGKIVYLDGTEKSWLDVYQEELDKPVDQKTFSFVEGTTLMTSFNSNTDFSKIVVPEGIQELESCFNNNFVACDVELPVSLNNMRHSFDNARDMAITTREGSHIVAIDNVLYSNAGATLWLYPEWKTDEEYIMPDTVTAIAPEALIDNPYLKKIVFSNNLQTIAMNGVDGCPAVTVADLPDTVQIIDSSFNRMIALESLEIPKNCELQGLNFTRCPAMKLTVHPDNPYYTCENDVLYNKDKTTLIRYMEVKEDERFETPSTVTDIGASAFAFNKHLEILTINEGVTTVGTFFADCNALTTVNLPASLTSIKTMTFTRLPKLTSVNFAGTMEQWLHVDKGVDWIISSLEYKLNCSDESISYKGTT